MLFHNTKRGPWNPHDHQIAIGRAPQDALPLLANPKTTAASSTKATASGATQTDAAKIETETVTEIEKGDQGIQTATGGATIMTVTAARATTSAPAETQAAIATATGGLAPPEIANRATLPPQKKARNPLQLPQQRLPSP